MCLHVPELSGCLCIALSANARSYIQLYTDIISTGQLYMCIMFYILTVYHSHTINIAS